MDQYTAILVFFYTFTQKKIVRGGFINLIDI